jgi:hypothetical protein
MITERLQLLSDELQTKFVFTVDEYGEMTDMVVLEEMEGIPIPRFAILIDDGNLAEKYILSVLESPQTIYFGSDLCETTKVFVSADIEKIFETMKKEVLSIRGVK